MACNEHLSYWDSFYGRSSLPLSSLPSQFATFALGEILSTVGDATGIDGVIEFGCGNGRDSHFFANHGFKLLALDASEQAIELCRARNQYDHAWYRVCKASASGQEVEKFLHGKQRVAVYARFFLHAIDENEQQAFLALLGKVLGAGSLLFLEYRTVGDSCQRKIFGDDHYRRYLDHHEVLSVIEASGFTIAYEFEGQGLAKYQSEDARVGRCFAVKD